MFKKLLLIRIRANWQRSEKLSPLLFNMYIEELITEALGNTEEGAKVGGKIIKALRFADDQATLAGSESDLQRMMDRLSVNYNMKMNTKKNTKVMRVSK